MTDGGNPESTESSAQGGENPATSLETLLSNVDESQRNAIMSEVRSARSEAAKYRTSLRNAEEKAAELDKLKAEKLSEEEKAQQKAQEAEKRYADAQRKYATAEIRANAADFADPDDAVRFLDIGDYVDQDGNVDDRRIKDDLAELLSRKPHLKRAAGDGRPSDPRENWQPERRTSETGPAPASPRDALAKLFADKYGYSYSSQ